MATINMMALRHSAFYAPYLMTISGGYLEKEGLQPAYTLQTPDKLITDAFMQGQCHVAQSAVATSFTALEAGDECNIVHFAQINERDGFFITAREADEYFSWHKLVDSKVLVDHLFQPIATLKYGLHRQGIDYDQLNVIDAGDVQQIDLAFRGGQADYVHQQGPAAQQLEKDGVGHVVAAVSDIVGPVAFSSLCADRQWLETDMAASFMHAYRQAREFVINAPAADTAKLLSPQLPGIDIDVLTSTIAAYQSLGCWTPDTRITQEAYDNLLEVFLFSGLISQRHAYNQCVVLPPET